MPVLGAIWNLEGLRNIPFRSVHTQSCKRFIRAYFNRTLICWYCSWVRNTRTHAWYPLWSNDCVWTVWGCPLEQCFSIDGSWQPLRLWAAAPQGHKLSRLAQQIYFYFFESLNGWEVFCMPHTCGQCVAQEGREEAVVCAYLPTDSSLSTICY